jgi:hypothetical protein
MTTMLTETYGTKPRAASRAADMLCLAAAPVFAALALLTAGSGDMICTMPGISALGGMSLMYVLMSLVHLAPWLKRNSPKARKGE